ncbi:MAG: acylneuraminate cytidylyltransferase family protein [Clostridia bacterium]|nr:acylneuraminate cytidylyltransferase family protein [Clostridia bacterium]
MKEHRNIAIIPARSGSKGLKDKNIRTFNGKPLLAYSIEAAQDSGKFDEVFVSTDSENYADIGRKYGAHVPFLRSPELSTDTASSWDVVKDVLTKFKNGNIQFDTIALLQPTSPLRTSQDIVNAFRIMHDKKANAVVSICEVDHSPLWCNTLPEDGSLVGFLPTELVTKTRQKLDTYYRINGAIYLVNVGYLFSSQTIYDSRCYAYKMEKRHSIDIDDLVDFQIAEMIDKLSIQYTM